MPYTYTCSSLFICTCTANLSNTTQRMGRAMWVNQSKMMPTSMTEIAVLYSMLTIPSHG